MRLVVFVAVCHLQLLLPSILLLVSARLPVSRISVSMATGPPGSVLQVPVSVALGASSSPVSPVTITKALVVSVIVTVAVALTIVLYPISKRSPAKPLLVSVRRERLPVVPELPPVPVVILGPAWRPAPWHPPRSHKVTRRREGGFHSVGGRHPKAPWPWPRRGPSVHHVGRHVSRWHQGEALQRRGRHSWRSLERYQTRPGTQEAGGWSLQPNNGGWRRRRHCLSAWNTTHTQTNIRGWQEWGEKSTFFIISNTSCGMSNTKRGAGSSLCQASCAGLRTVKRASSLNRTSCCARSN